MNTVKQTVSLITIGLLIGFGAHADPPSPSIMQQQRDAMKDAPYQPMPEGYRGSGQRYEPPNPDMDRALQNMRNKDLPPTVSGGIDRAMGPGAQPVVLAPSETRPSIGGVVLPRSDEFISPDLADCRKSVPMSGEKYRACEALDGWVRVNTNKSATGKDRSVEVNPIHPETGKAGTSLGVFLERGRTGDQGSSTRGGVRLRFTN